MIAKDKHKKYTLVVNGRSYIYQSTETDALHIASMAVLSCSKGDKISLYVAGEDRAIFQYDCWVGGQNDR